MASSLEELNKMLDHECSRCGCPGLHACIGYRPPPITPEEEARLSATLDKIFREVAREEGREMPSPIPEISIEKSRVISDRGRELLIDTYTRDMAEAADLRGRSDVIANEIQKAIDEQAVNELIEIANEIQRKIDAGESLGLC